MLNKRVDLFSNISFLKKIIFKNYFRRDVKIKIKATKNNIVEKYFDGSHLL